jgi:hypothetical protein
MVFHVTNYMKETNVWMLRKFRWVLWSFFLSIPVYRNTYWDYHARRVAWGRKLDRRTDEEQMEAA